MTTLDKFLQKHIPSENSCITHTRIGKSEMGIPGGRYSIPLEDLPLFYKLYHKKVFINNKSEFLVERQIIGGGSPILIDLDFKFLREVETRQHNEEHIRDIINVYLDKLHELVDVRDQTEFPIFVFEKPNVQTMPDITKDGIHIIIGIHMDSALQLMLRDKVLTDIEQVLNNLNLQNTIDNVVDIALTRGSNGFTMFGSRKPEGDAYELTYYFNAEWEGGEWSYLTNNKDSIDTLDILQKISTYSKKNIKYEILDNMKELYDKQKKKKNNKITHSAPAILQNQLYSINFNNINTKEALKNHVENLIKRLPTPMYHLRETYQFVMILPCEYYNEEVKWIAVGWALHNTSFNMFLVWMLFSSQSEKFDFQDIPHYYEMWETMRNEGITERSIMYWARESKPEEYKKIYEQTIDYFVEFSISNKSDHSLALVLYNMFKGLYVCASIKHKIWYQFIDNKWLEVDSGTTLREKISKDMAYLFHNKCEILKNKATQEDQDPAAVAALTQKCAIVTGIFLSLGQVHTKNNIMREAQELFYEKDFLEKLDANPYLLHFTNGIFDFKEGRFRKGKPEDYISLSTKQPYITFNKKNKKHNIYQKEINNFFEKLFTDEELRRYMWEHLSSALIGTNENETFNIYNGVGRNGKSKLVDLMTKVLGELKGVVPITILTRKRGESGKASPELARLRGIRYAVMQEPSKNDKINEGIMKELTGGDTIQARALFHDPIEFKPQFKLVVCTNNLFDIESNDEGTWRRIRVCEFLSKFTSNPSTNVEDREFEGMHPTKLLAKFDEWLGIFTWMLTEVAKKKKGIVKDCELVVAASKKYRGEQDYFGGFMDAEIDIVPNKRLKIQECYEIFKDWWADEGYGRNVPRRGEIQALIEKKFGKYPKTGWKGYCLKGKNDG